MLSMRPVSGGVQVSVDSQEPISAVALRFDGVAVQGDVVEGFEDAVLKSGRKDGEQWRYQAVYRGQHPRGVLQVTAQTEAAKVRSMTLRIGGN